MGMIVQRARRVVVKVGSSLVTNEGRGLDDEATALLHELNEGFTSSAQAIEETSQALTSVNGARADLGAIQNRFTSVVANLQTSSENLAASRSRIRDTDFAKETAELTRTQILQQAGTAMLAQANQVPQNVMSLLRN